MTSRQSRGSRLQKLRPRPVETNDPAVKGNKADGSNAAAGFDASHHANTDIGTNPDNGQHRERGPSGKSRAFPEPPSLDPYVGKLERFELFCTNQNYYLVGCNKLNLVYRVIKIDRSKVEWPPDNTIKATASVATATAPSAKIPVKETRPALKSSASNSPKNVPGHSRDENGTNSAENQAIADASHRPKPTLRPLSDFLTEDPNVYTQAEIHKLLKTWKHENGTRRRGGSNDDDSMTPISKAYGVVGFIRFLDCYYLTLITRRAKVGSIGGNGIYTIKSTESFPIKPSERGHDSSGDHDVHADPSSVLLSMWNRGKRSVGLGLSNREIAELRYQGLYQVIDLTKNFFFSYTYDLTRGLQQNFLATTSKPFPPPPFKDMYAWNFFLTRELDNCTNSLTSFHWILPVIHGAFVQRKLNDYGRNLNVILLARRSRHFAGTRYLKRGVSEQGKVANDVEHEQILHDESTSIYSSYLQVRGSIPTFWTQESSVTVPKPAIELNRVDPAYKATQLHFEDLMKRYGSPIVVLDLVKQSEKREREVRVGNEYRHAVDYINTSIDSRHKIQYCALDYSHISKHRHLDVSQSLNEVSTWSVNQTGYFCSAPKWKITRRGQIEPFSAEDLRASSMLSQQLGVPIFPMEQTGVLRTNCIDCLDRTNVAQFSAGVEAMEQQLVVMGIRSSVKLDSSSNIVKVLIDMYVDIGDHIALQYGGSEAHKKVSSQRSESNIAGPIGKHKELLTSIRRYYSNAFTDQLKQDAMNLFLGFYVPYMHTTPLWEIATDYYLHISKSRLQSMKVYKHVYGVLSWDDEIGRQATERRASSSSSLQASNHRGRAERSESSTSLLSQETSISRLDSESYRMTRVRERCELQNKALSSWWKGAIHSNVQQRMWMKLGRIPTESHLPPRFERIYQPGKMAQFDRFFARTWATPMRRSHSAQQTDGIDNDLEESRFPRIFSDRHDQNDENGRRSGELFTEASHSTMTIEKYLSANLAGSLSESSAKSTGDNHSAKERFGDSVKSNRSVHGKMGDRAGDVPEEYKRYVQPLASNSADPFSNSTALREFKHSLHGLSLGANDVNGIRELAQSAHVGQVISSGGPYRGLDRTESAIEVTTVIHEQLNALENMRRRGELREGIQIMDMELRRRGMHTAGVKAAVLGGRNRHMASEKVYREFLRPPSLKCQKSDLTNSHSLHLYTTCSPPEETLRTQDLAFIMEKQFVSPKRAEESSPPHTSSNFVSRAARLNIPMSSYAQVRKSKPPALFESGRRASVPSGFEMINDDMFARKDNKFMVFNGAGIDTWQGIAPVTKITGIETMLLGSLD